MSLFNSIKALILIASVTAVMSLACSPKPLLKSGATIAVWDLDDLSPETYGRPELGELLSGQVIETIQKKRTFLVVERERLLLIINELHLGTTALIDERTKLKLGRLAGARFMVFGGFQIIAENMRFDLRLVEVETGKVIKAVQKTSYGDDLPGLIETAGKATEELFRGF